MTAKVQGQPSLEKDLETGAIINTDRASLLAARRLKERILKEKQEVVDLKEQVANLTTLVQSLLNKENK